MLLSSAQPRNYGVMAMKQVKIGVGFGLWRLGMPPAETIARVAERAEDWGLDSFWLSDHLLAPSPELDVVATLSLLASRTSRMKLGPSVLLLNLRHPLMVAKSFASLDYLSNGRMVMAVGTGANLADYARAISQSRDAASASTKELKCCGLSGAIASRAITGASSTSTTSPSSRVPSRAPTTISARWISGSAD